MKRIIFILAALWLSPFMAAGGAEVFGVASNIFARATVVSYRHLNASASAQVQTNASGDFVSRTDCSGFVSFVLSRCAPRALAAVPSGAASNKHPRAKTYAQFFKTLETNHTASGWQAVPDWRDLRTGDIIAWASSPHTNANGAAHNSGHVMFVAEKPGGPQTELVDGKQERFAVVRVLDSSSVKHFPPETFPPRASQTGRNGLGFGYIRLWLDDHDKPVGYWEGTWWGEGQKPIRHPAHDSVLGFGRVVDE